MRANILSALNAYAHSVVRHACTNWTGVSMQTLSFSTHTDGVGGMAALGCYMARVVTPRMLSSESAGDGDFYPAPFDRLSLWG